MHGNLHVLISLDDASLQRTLAFSSNKGACFNNMQNANFLSSYLTIATSPNISKEEDFRASAGFTLQLCPLPPQREAKA
jgi:hypothetical protein